MNKKVLHTVIDHLSIISPESIAIEEGEKSINYSSLKEKSDRITNCLVSIDVKKGDPIGVYLASSINYVCSILGIMKAGAVFMPLELAYPVKRLEYLLETVSPSLVITNKENLESFLKTYKEADSKALRAVILIEGQCNPEILKINNCEVAERFIYEENDRKIVEVDGDDSNYILYTSGSTGNPKIIEGCHKSLSHFIHWEQAEFVLEKNTKVSQLAPLSFDVSLRDIFVPLLSGGTLCIPDKALKSDSINLLRWIGKSQVTLMHTVPSVFRLLTKALKDHPELISEIKQLRYILLAGEALYGRDVLEWRKIAGDDIELVNLYGPTETTLAKIYNRIGKTIKDPNAIIPLGKAITNTFIIIISNNQICNTGAIGEIHIKTPFRSKGYYKDEALTREKFIQNPLHNDYEDIIYKTGDLGRYQEDKNIEFVGRLDSQIKIRGNRVEVSEIEKVVNGYEGIDQVVVVPTKKEENEDVLTCYYVERGPVEESSLKSYLHDYLPDYMHPSYYVKMDEFPLNLNGKIDKRALPRPEELLYDKLKYEAPSNQLEDSICSIWSELLGLKKVGVKNSFFELGGHSLTATRVVSRLYKELGKEISLKDFFDHSTVKSLAEFLGRKEQGNFKEIAALPTQEYYELSHAQRRLWVLNKIEEESPAYNIYSAYFIEGGLNEAAFQKSFEILLERHESLRTTFITVDGQPKQKISLSGLLPAIFSVINVSEEEDSQAKAREIINNEVQTVFDLEQGPLVRVKLIQLENQKHICLITIHHIISDGWSVAILTNELLQIYHNLNETIENFIPPLKIQYKDFAAWQNEQLEGEKLEEHRGYWLNKFKGELTTLEILTDFKRPTLKTYNGNVSKYIINKDISYSINHYCADKKVSLFTFLLTALKTLLYRYSGQSDIIIGTPIAGREHSDLENQVGLFVNTLALRTQVTDGGFDELLKKVKETVVEAYDHQIYPFDKLVDDLNIPRNLSHSPLFDVLIVLQNFDELNKSKVSFPEIKVSEYATDRVTSKFDLTFNFSETQNGLLLTVEYNTDLFAESTIQRMASHFEQLSKSILENEKTFISELKYLSSDETNKLLSDFNSTSLPFCNNKTLHQLFENQAKETADKAAVLFNGKAFTFKEIDEKSTKLASYLRTRYEIESDQLVPLIADRSEWMIIAILGILKSGAAYVPIDPDYPTERINYILQDASARMVITDKKRVLSNICPTICLETEWKEIDEEPALQLDNICSQSNLAYAIYTSGSTGRPKGVLIEHKGAVNRIEWMWKHYNFTTEDIIFQKTTYTFDVSVWEIFLPLCYGATQVICSKEVIYTPSDIIDHIHRYSITTLHFVPSMLSLFLEEINENNEYKLQSLRHVMASGEALSSELVKKFYSNLEVPLQNLYGPTEASVDVSYYETKQADEIIPIGKPISNIKLYILDDKLSLVHIGGMGEICISGVGLARGYRNLPDLTREKFVDNPFEQESKLYRTGDLGRWLEDGNIEFIGRKDHQVKIRGFRIELGEIENSLLQFKGIKECVVISRKDATGSELLIAYYIAEEELDEISIREHLKSILPDYMIPHLFMRLDFIPLTSSGKADRKNLPTPETSFVALKDQEVKAPSSKMEESLMEIWSQVLGKEIKSVSSNFFHIGGDSIKAIQISSRLYKAGFKIEIRDIFRYPTIAELAHATRPITRIADQSSVEGEIPLTPIQADFFEKYRTDIHHFNQAIMLFSENGFDENALIKSFEKIQEHHDALRITFEISTENTKAINNSVDQPLSLKIFDLRGIENDRKWLEDKCNELQESFDLQKGPLFKVALFKLEDGDRLFMVAHHLIMDGLSWRILFEDLQTLNKQYHEDQPLQLPLKTDSFKRWSEKLIEYSRSNEFLKEIEYWTKIESEDIPQISHHDTAAINERLSTLSFVLSKKDTIDLVTKVNEAYNTNINDTLLTSLGLSIKQLFGLEKVLIMLEGHGREEIIKDIDVTRTIGWFTSLYPIVLEFSIEDNLSRQLKEVKEYLRKVPANGIGYGIWKYTSGKSGQDKSSDFNPQILFNYLGHIEAETSNQAFAIAKESTGRSKGTTASSPYDWEIEGHIIDDSLKISLRYKEHHFKSEILRAFMNCYEENLLQVIKHCLNQENHEITPSDLTLNDLTFEEIEKLESLFN